MLYRLQATVDGHLYLQRPKATISAERPPYRFQLESGKDGRVLAASVTTRVPEATREQFHSTLARTPGGPADSHLTFSCDPVLCRQLLEQLQQLESVLALNFAFRREGNPLKRIRWHEAEEILIPETEEEEQRVHVFHCQFSAANVTNEGSYRSNRSKDWWRRHPDTTNSRRS